ncbi:hypothetical protein GYMLUDRAFT_74039 [Collybiopsis luxurians FD-317 M1]|uniref:Terpene synthase n=1 Tax=Collybiopsis luxurians FD-317 M1 TaxID=944289 RepID=A0A0D0CNG6_9AGAR|nr:hypothetical protein GYMLUDRAFT_74039 [Collybiopsis luxurians FD-317 M1]
MKPSPPTHFVLPNLLANWPFVCKPNPHQEIVAESAAWVESYHPFDSRAQAAFNRCKFGIFASLAYPCAEEEHFRVVCDLMNFFFVFDELSDQASGEVVAQQAADIMNALRNPDQAPTKGDSILGAMTRDFWKRTLQCCSESSAQRFITNFDEYTNSVWQQAVDRDLGIIRDTTKYFELRRGTIGVRPSFDYFILPADIPDEVIEHPQVERLVIGAIDMTILANDIYSYNKEQATGDDAHNIISVMMKEEGLSVQEAIDRAGSIYCDIAKKFCKDFENLPVFGGQLDQCVKEYCWGVGNWVTTNIKWSFASERYFGRQGMEVMEHRIVELRPQEG